MKHVIYNASGNNRNAVLQALYIFFQNKTLPHGKQRHVTEPQFLLTFIFHM